MPLASSHEFVARMKSHGKFRTKVTGFSDRLDLKNYLKSAGYEFGLPDLFKAMAACMAELEQDCSQ